MNRNQKIIVSIVGITIVMLALLGITYAYYLTRIEGNTNTNSISVTTADLSLVYGDGNTNILTSETLLMPGEFEGTKDFTVTNNGNSSVTYGVILEDMINPLKRSQDMKMTLSCSTNKEDGCVGLDEMNLPSTNEFLVENTIEVGETHTFELKLRYIEAGEDQSIDMGKTISGRVNIISSHDTVDMTGDVANYEDGDYVKVGDSKISYITNEGKYKVVGLNPNQYVISVYKSDGTLKGTKDLTIKSGTIESISDSEIIITKDTRLIKMDITNINSDATIITGSTLLDKHNPFKGGTLAYAILDSAKTESYEPFTELEMKLADVDENGLITKEDSDYINEYVTKEIEVLNIGEKFIYNGQEYIFGDINMDGTVTTVDVMKVNSFVKKYELYLKYETSIDFNTLSSANEKILSYTNDDYGTSYFYRGNVTNNYVTFSGMCWRIVRIQGDGSVKLTLESQSSCSESMTSNFSIGYADWGYKVEYGKFIGDYKNSTSGMKNLLNTWFDTNFKSDENLTNAGLKIKNEEWCLGNITKTYAYNSPYGELGTTAIKNYASNTNFYYETGRNLYGLGVTANATLKCNGETDISKIGALTADEVVFAGGKAEEENADYYLQNNNYYWWTLSHFDFYQSGDDIFCVNYRGALLYRPVRFDDYDVRPAVTLNAGVKITGGEGTKGNSYIINEE